MSTDRKIRIIWTGFNGVAHGHGTWQPESKAEQIKLWAQEMSRSHTLGQDITIGFEWNDKESASPQSGEPISQITRNVVRELV